MIRRAHIVALVCIAIASSTHAQQQIEIVPSTPSRSTPVVFSRTAMALLVTPSSLIIAEAEKQATKEGSANGEGKDRQPPTGNNQVMHELFFELRAAESLTEGSISMAAFDARSGVMVLLPKPHRFVYNTRILHDAADIAFLNRTGEVVEVHPAAKLEELDELRAERPIFALMHLKAGALKNLDIKPGDRVTHPLFKEGSGPTGLVIQGRGTPKGPVIFP